MIFDFIDAQVAGNRVLRIVMDNEVDSTTGTILCNRDESFDGILGKVEGEVGNGQEAERFSNFSGRKVIFADVRVFIAQIFLNDFFKVFEQPLNIFKAPLKAF